MSGMYDLHTHSILSDGEMLPIELIVSFARADSTPSSTIRTCPSATSVRLKFTPTIMPFSTITPLGARSS